MLDTHNVRIAISTGRSCEEESGCGELDDNKMMEMGRLGAPQNCQHSHLLSGTQTKAYQWTAADDAR